MQPELSGRKEAVNRGGRSIKFLAKLPEHFPLIVDVLLDDLPRLRRARRLVDPPGRVLGRLGVRDFSLSHRRTAASVDSPER